ncbi:MAG: TolC family protein [Bacteroidales bacterium]|nr:TolC family protein [Bacteroidales bacterium]
MKYIAKTLVILITVLFSNLYGQNSQLSLSVKDAEQYAIEHNKTMENANLEIKKAEAARWQSIASMLPQVEGSAGYTNMCGYEINFGVMSRKMLPYINIGTQASIALNGQLIVAALLSNLAIEMQDITRSQSESNLRANVKTTYLAVLIEDEIIQLLDSSLQNIQSLAEITQNAVNAGAAEQTSADQIKVRVNTLNNNINMQKRNRELALNSMRVLLAVPAETELVLTETIDDILAAEKVQTLLDENFVIARNHNYQLLQKNVDLAKKQVVLASMAYTPTISAFYQYNYRKDIGDGGFSMSPPHTVGVSMSVPLFSSGKKGAAIEEKKIAYMEAQNTFEETTDNLNIQYQQLRYNLSNAYETYLNEKDNLDVTQRVFASTTNKYQWGTVSTLELTNASNDLISAQSNYVQAVLTLVNAQVELEKFLNSK